jgi:uncharacterized membrane protein
VTEQGRYRIIAVLAVLGLAISAYLAWTFSTGGPMLCVGTQGCETVRASRYSAILGVPLGIIGIAFYLALLAVALWKLVERPSSGDLPHLAVFGLAVSGAVFSAYLTYLELFVIGAVCSWCVSSAVVVAMICVLSGWNLRETVAADPGT